MRFVVDASVAVKLLVDEPDSDAARALTASGEELHAPRLMASEVANALWRKARLGQIERADAGELDRGPVGEARDEREAAAHLRKSST